MQYFYSIYCLANHLLYNTTNKPYHSPLFQGSYHLNEKNVKHENRYLV